MGNKWKFIFDYYKYIENIDNLSYIDDNIVYEEINSRLKFGRLPIVEGLIYTCPISKSVDIIKRRFKYLTIEVESEGDIYITGFKNDTLEKYLPIIENLGYFISTYTSNGSDWLKLPHDEKERKNIKAVALYLEPKYDYEIDNIPSKLYHASPLKFKNKILKYGLSPRTGNKLTNHPDRIYLTDDVNKSYNFGMNLKSDNNKFYEDGFCIYMINGSSLQKLYSDVNLREGGYYTMNNINIDDIKLIKEIKL